MSLRPLLQESGELGAAREMEAVVAGVTAVRIALPVPDPANPPAPPDRPPNALELGQLASLRRICRLRLGLSPVEEGGVGGAAAGAGAGGTAGPAAAAAGAGAPAAGGVPLGQQKIKVSQIFDQADETEISP